MVSIVLSFLIIPPSIYAEGYIVFVFLFVRSFVIPSRSWNYFQSFTLKQLKRGISKQPPSESIPIWTIGTLEGRLLLYPRHLYRGYIVFVFPFVCSFVRTFVPFVKLLQSFTLKQLEWSYLTNHSSENIHIWTIGTLEGRLSFHDSSPQGPCPGVGLEVKI